MNSSVGDYIAAAGGSGEKRQSGLEKSNFFTSLSVNTW
jgi:hypothetical protein